MAVGNGGHRREPRYHDPPNYAGRTRELCRIPAILPGRADGFPPLLRQQNLTSRILKPCYTSRAIDCCQLRSRFQEGPPDLPVRRCQLKLPTVQCRGRSVKNIFVGNLSFNTNEDELRQLFEGYGPVDRVSIMTDRDTGRSRGFGFVEMTNNNDGEKAITALNGSQVGGRTINVNEARPKNDRGGRPGPGAANRRERR